MNVPGSSLPVESLAAQIHLASKARGKWDTDPSMSESLIHIIEDLSRASLDYAQDRILPTSFYRPTGPQMVYEGVVVRLASAVVSLLDLGARYRLTPKLWDGVDRHHTRFYEDLFSVMARVLRLREDYPVDAVQMIERLAAAYVSRAEFWQVVRHVASLKETK